MAYTKTTWIDKAVQYAKRYFMNSDGGNDKNLLPPFTDWTLHANAVATLPYTLTLTATGTFQFSDSPTIPVVVGQVYRVSHTLLAANSYCEVYESDSLTTGFTLLNSQSAGTGFSVTPTKNYARVRYSNGSVSTGTFTFTNPQLELGSTATAFTPKKMYTITQSGGTVTSAGTPVNAAMLNKMEQGIADALRKDGSEAMTGALGIQSFNNLPNQFLTGNADNASYTLHNIKFKGWYGMGMSTFDDSVNGFYDFRLGKWDVKDGFYVNGTKMAQTRTTNGYVEWNNGGTWQGVGGVKSVQRGTAVITSGGDVNVTISAVNMSKSTVTFNNAGNLSSSGSYSVYAHLTTTTNLLLKSSTTSFTGTVAWEVVEFYG
jgi:hypothetical protein